MAAHRLVAVDVIAVLESYRQIACFDERYVHLAALGAPREGSAHA